MNLCFSGGTGNQLASSPARGATNARKHTEGGIMSVKDTGPGTEPIVVPITSALIGAVSRGDHIPFSSTSRTERRVFRVSCSLVGEAVGI